MGSLCIYFQTKWDNKIRVYNKPDLMMEHKHVVSKTKVTSTFMILLFAKY